METIYCRIVPSRDESVEVIEVVDPPEPSTSEKRKRSSPAEEAETKKIKTDQSDRQFIPVTDEDEPMPEIKTEEQASDCDKEVESIMSSQRSQNDSLRVDNQEANTTRRVTVVMSYDGTFMTRIILHPFTKEEPKPAPPKLELESPNSPKRPSKPTRRSVPLQDTCSTTARRNSLRHPKPGGGAGAMSRVDTSRRESLPKPLKVVSKPEVVKPLAKHAEAKPVAATSQTGSRTTRLSAGQAKTTPKPTRSSAPDAKKTGVKPKETTTKKEDDSTKKSTITTRSKSKSPRKGGSFRR
ncbi:proteoglycan 4-like [Harmonia axyridis]|uniref:proteoglycan 4-like n=1 Tax=Harmonia axyridis TaxID=115357 RepID=UPI001E2787DD|nr:proteoglycan 4-like [Harmonia axyridis]